MIDWVQHLGQGEFLALCIVSIGLSLAGATGCLICLGRARTMEDTPTSRIRSAAQGPVELEGIADLLPGEPVLSPLSRQPCAWWEYSIEKKETTYSNGRSSSRWRTLEQGISDEMFQLTDDTGQCIVDPEGASVIPDQKRVWHGRSRWPTEVPRASAWIGFGQFRYRERLITPGSALYAMGWFRTEGGLGTALDLQAETRELLASWKQDQAALLREFDANGDGQIDLQEWENVRRKAMQEVQARQLQQAIEPDLHVLCRPPRREKFILSTLPQEHLIKRSRRFAALGLALFLAAGSLGVWVLSVR